MYRPKKHRGQSIVLLKVIRKVVDYAGEHKGNLL